jgi:hypothetical protein
MLKCSSKGFRLQISQTEVERLIKIGIGADKRTVQKYVRMLTEDLGFLKAVAKTLRNRCLQNRCSSGGAVCRPTLEGEAETDETKRRRAETG